MSAYEKTKRMALKEARIALNEMYQIDLNNTDIIGAIKDLGLEKVDNCIREIRDFCSDLNEKLAAAPDYNGIGNVMTNAAVAYNWENPLLDYVQDIA